MIPSKEKVCEIIKELQKILRIQDWNIDFRWMDKDEFEKEFENDNQAHNDVTRVLNASLITINKDTTCDWYKSLLHELIHLTFDHMEMATVMVYQLTTNKIQDALNETLTVAIERTVERYADILSELYPVTHFIKEDEKTMSEAAFKAKYSKCEDCGHVFKEDECCYQSDKIRCHICHENNRRGLK